MTGAAQQLVELLCSLLDIAGRELHLTGCVGARIVQGLPRLTDLRDTEDSLIL